MIDVSPELETPRPRSSFAVPVGIATVQGMLLWWLAGAAADRAWPATSAVAYCTVLALSVFLPPVLYGLSRWFARPLVWALLAAVVAFLLGTALHFGANLETPGLPSGQAANFPFPLLLLDFVFLFHAVPFLQIYLEQGHWRPDYRRLFLFTWQNALQLALAALFTGVFWALVWLWAQLFKMIGLPFPSVLLFADPRFSLFILAVAFGTGFHLTGSAERLLAALRQQVLTLLKWLTPVAALILVVFVVALLLRTPELLAAKRHVIGAAWLLWLTAVTVYLFNSAYQDGTVPEPYGPNLGRALRYVTPLLVFTAGMATYALLVRTQAYGLTVSRAWGLLVALVALGYGLTYLWAAWRSTTWMAEMRRANVWVALFVLVVLGLMLTPILSPQRLAAASLSHRLRRATDPSTTLEDYMVLRFDEGVFGPARLGELATSTDGPQAAEVRATARAALALHAYSDRFAFAHPVRDATRLAFEAFPAGQVVDPGLRAAIAGRLPRLNPPSPANDSADEMQSSDDYPGPVREPSSVACTAAKPCPVLFVDLNGDAIAEAVLFWNRTAWVFELHEGHWQPLWAAHTTWCRRCDQSQISKALRQGKFTTVAATWRSLRIGEGEFELSGLETPGRDAMAMPGDD